MKRIGEWGGGRDGMRLNKPEKKEVERAGKEEMRKTEFPTASETYKAKLCSDQLQAKRKESLIALSF